jgi:NADPH:quinone reductase-like Zn-dependent oxidoreductase
MTSYRCVVATRRGGAEVLEVVERELRDPRPDEVRVRVQAASVSLVDVQARQGRGPFQQKAAFVPGYAVVGQIDALGDEVAGFAPGDRVAVLTEINGYAEYVYVRRNPILRISDSVDAAAAVTLVLNYLVAYQVLHRRSRVQAGDRVLIIGAGGGIGTALCELGQLAGLVMYGVDSAAKHHALARYGVVPIDPRTDDFGGGGLAGRT